MKKISSSKGVLARSKLKDPDMQAAPLALARAAKNAQKLAFETGTPLVMVVNGVLVKDIPRKT